MKELDIEEIHKGTIEIIKKYIEICDSKNLTYYTAYGSLIGVVRHEGFIPWDDDFDVQMFREDYERFISYCIKHEKELYPFKIFCNKNVKNYPYNIARFCDMRYKLVSNNNSKDIDGMGMFIDIYPLDGAGNGKYISSKLFRKKDRALISLACKANKRKLSLDQSGIHKFTYPVAYIVSKIIGLKILLKLLRKQGELYKIEDSRFVSNLVWSFYPQAFPKKWYSKVIQLKFEDITVSVPVGYKSLLTFLYGDYMKLPPKESRIAQHEYKLYRK